MNLATEMREIVLLTRKRISTDIEMIVGTDFISTNNVKYLGMIHVDCRLIFWKHIQAVYGKAAKVTHRSG